MKSKTTLRKLLFLTLGMLTTTLFLLVAMLTLPTIIPALSENKTKNLEVSSETDTSFTEVLTSDFISESTSETNTSTSLSYAEQCELSYVAPPEKQTTEEALETIKAFAPYYPAMYIVYKNAEKYPDEILKSLASNPEMLDYCIGYLTSDGSITGGITEDEKPEDHPLFLQWDKRWGYMAYGSVSTIAASGCGPSCLSMAVYYLTGDTSATVDDVASYSLEHNYYIEGIGTSWSLLNTYPTLYGLRVTHPTLSEKNLKKHLDKGNYLICSMKPGQFTSGGHFLLIYGYDENGFQINDPKCVYRSRQTWSYNQIKDEIKHVWSIGK